MSNSKLKKLIENKRTELLEIVSEHGINSQITLKNSLELDKLINDYNRLKNNRKKEAKS